MATLIEKLTEKQASYIKFLLKELDWDADLVAAWLNHHKADEISGLSKREAIKGISDLLYYLELLHSGAWDGMATGSQVSTIYAKWRAIDVDKGTINHLSEFLTKRWKVATPEELTCQQADKCIKAIAGMKAQNDRRAGKTTVLKRKTCCKYCGQKVMWVELKDGRRMAFDFNNRNEATGFHECKNRTIPGYGAGC